MDMTIAIGQSAQRKIRRHILPFFMFAYMLNFFDRMNLSFAALTMNKDLAITATAFGLAAGLFSAGYFIFEVPSNLAMEKFGARIWIARIMVTWGIVATCMSFITNVTGLYVARFLLGVAEAGFYPGMLLFLTYWFLEKEHGKATAYLLLGMCVAGIIGAPIAGAILQNMNGLAGLVGWKWLFIIEGIPSIIFGIFVYFWLPDSPQKAKWLTDEEKNWIVNAIKEENKANSNVDQHKSHNIFKTLSSPVVIVLALAYSMYGFGYYGMNYFTPQLIKSAGTGLSTMSISLLTMIPYIGTIIGLLAWSRYSDKTGKRRVPLYAAAIIGGVALILMPHTTSLAGGIALLFFVAVGLGGIPTTFWPTATQLLTPKERAAALALINSFSALGGFFGPYLMGAAKDATGSWAVGMAILGSGLLLLGALMFVVFKMTQVGKGYSLPQ
ncbi:MFS transporter [Desulfosporosinus fructosivorans]